MLQHHFIKFFPHKLLNFDVLILHITNNYGQHFTINTIIHMTSHSCPTNNTLHMIKHDPNILQIPCRLHLCDEADSILDTIYGHLENEHLLSINSLWETTFLDVIIPILGLQLKYVINIATCWMMFEINNKVLNVGRSKFNWMVICWIFSASTNLQVELPSMLVNNVKHVSTKRSFLKYSWHLRFFNWHIVKTLTSAQLFWMIKCTRGWMKWSRFQLSLSTRLNN